MPDTNIYSPRQKNLPSRFGRLESWLAGHLDTVALSVVAVSLVIRLERAWTTCFNPDEALHYLLADQASLGNVYQASLSNAHPPLIFFLLYGWLSLGHSEIWLRLISVLAGTATLWAVYRWLGAALGRVQGLIALLIMAFAPTTISLSVEVRGYAVLLFFMAMSLWLLEAAIAGKSGWRMTLSGMFLYLAILTHYSAAWFTLAVGLYGLWRIARGDLPARPAWLWAGLQAGAAALYGFLYVTHISVLRHSVIAQEASARWLEGSYFHWGHDSLLAFTLWGTGGAFAFMFASRVLAVAAILLFLAGVALLIIELRPNAVSSLRPGFGGLLLLPFAAAYTAALMGLYPYGASRHIVFLMLFAVAGISHVLAAAARHRIAWVLLPAALLAPLWLAAPQPASRSLRSEDQRRELMAGAIKYLRSQVRSGETVFTDYQTAALLGYYLGRDYPSPQSVSDFRREWKLDADPDRAGGSPPAPIPGTGPPAAAENGWRPGPLFDAPQRHFLVHRYSGIQVVVSDRWSPDAGEFEAEFSHMRQAFGLNPDRPVWVMDAGWGDSLGVQLTTAFPGIRFPNWRAFGRKIVIFQMPAGFRPRCDEPARRALDWLAGRLDPVQAAGAKTILWPTCFPVPSGPGVLPSWAGRVATYDQFYRALASGSRHLDGFLPGLAFWVFDTPERQIWLMRRMNRRATSQMPHYSVILLATDPHAVAGLFEIRRNNPPGDTP